VTAEGEGWSGAIRGGSGEPSVASRGGEGGPTVRDGGKRGGACGVVEAEKGARERRTAPF
jgi:hypothetical protein